MKSHLLAGLALLCLFTARLAADDTAAIRTARTAQNAAIARGDLAAIASFWTDNVTICRGLGLQVAGKANYLDLFHPENASGLVYERLPDDVTVATDWPLAFETGHWVGRRNGQPLISGRYSAQWVREGDRWLIRGEVYTALEGQDSGKAMRAAPAAGADPVATIRELLVDFLTYNSDPARHANFWADDVIYTSSAALVRTKPMIMKSVTEAAAKADPAKPGPKYSAEDIVVRPYGDFAALTFRLVAQQPDGTTEYLRNSGSLVLRSGRWQVVTWQATRVPPAEKK